LSVDVFWFEVVVKGAGIKGRMLDEGRRRPLSLGWTGKEGRVFVPDLTIDDAILSISGAL
jgi:hypothetical protein